MTEIIERDGSEVLAAKRKRLLDELLKRRVDLATLRSSGDSRLVFRESRWDKNSYHLIEIATGSHIFKLFGMKRNMLLLTISWCPYGTIECEVFDAKVYNDASLRHFLEVLGGECDVRSVELIRQFVDE